MHDIGTTLKKRSMHDSKFAAQLNEWARQIACYGIDRCDTTMTAKSQKDNGEGIAP